MRICKNILCGGLAWLGVLLLMPLHPRAQSHELGLGLSGNASAATGVDSGGFIVAVQVSNNPSQSNLVRYDATGAPMWAVRYDSLVFHTLAQRGNHLVALVNTGPFHLELARFNLGDGSMVAHKRLGFTSSFGYIFTLGSYPMYVGGDGRVAIALTNSAALRISNADAGYIEVDSALSMAKYRASSGLSSYLSGTNYNSNFGPADVYAFTVTAGNLGNGYSGALMYRIAANGSIAGEAGVYLPNHAFGIARQLIYQNNRAFLHMGTQSAGSIVVCMDTDLSHVYWTRWITPEFLELEAQHPEDSVLHARTTGGVQLRMDMNGNILSQGILSSTVASPRFLAPGAGGRVFDLNLFQGYAWEAFPGQNFFCQYPQTCFSSVPDSAVVVGDSPHSWLQNPVTPVALLSLPALPLPLPVTTVGCVATSSSGLPSPSFSYSNTFGSFVFTNTSASVAGSAFMWTFGDGDSSSSASPSHVYAAPGSYVVCLRQSAGCQSSSFCDTVVASCPGPVAGFSTVGNLLSLALTNASTGGSSSFWTFGDGDSSTATSPTHTYAQAGTYTVCLISTDSCGSDTLCQAVTISCPVPSAAFTVMQTGLSFTFSSQSTGTSPLINSWTFGDGDTSSLASPVHCYANPGTYTVCLRVTDLCGSDSVCQLLTVVGMDDGRWKGLRLHPQPANESLMIAAVDGVPEIETLELCNAQGQVVWRAEAGLIAMPLVLGLRAFPSGLYWLRWRDVDGAAGVLKVMVAH